MSKPGETFFTVVGCMDGRVQDVMAKLGEKKFGALYPDTITEAGIVGLIANKPSKDFLAKLKFKLLVSVDRHHSKGILVDGHEKCAGNPVDDARHKKDIKKSVVVIKKMLKGKKIEVTGVYIRLSPRTKPEEV